jgi:hypothetical protein
MAKAKEKVWGATENVRPYVERAVKDEELRKNVRDAFDAAREVYNELLGGRGVVPLASRVATDEDIQENLKRAVEDLRKASSRIQGKADHGTRNATLLLVGIALGILFNPVTGPQTRKWLSDRIFGSADDEFTYQGSTQTGGNSGAGTAA